MILHQVGTHISVLLASLLVNVGTSAAAFDVPQYTLLDNFHMPKVGFGTFRIDPGQETYASVRWALDVGYRLIDTAAMYENEADVGRALAESGISRSDVFITTKLDTDSHGYYEALEAANTCLKNLNTPYVDLLLIHSPYGERIVETWDALVRLKDEGKARSIGVSNFGMNHLEALRRHGRPTPAVNQIEMHPLNYSDRKDLVNYCKKHGIIITAYGSLFSGSEEKYDEATLTHIASNYRKSVPQVLLRWALQNDFAIIPKSSSSRERQEENLSLFDFELTDEEVHALSEMEGSLGVYWNPIDDAQVDIGDLSHGQQQPISEL